MATFAERLRLVREAKGVSPYRLAQLTGLSKQGAINLEAEGSDPKLSNIVRLAEALGVMPWELLPGWKESSGVDRSTPAREPSPERPARVDHNKPGKAAKQWEAFKRSLRPV